MRGSEPKIHPTHTRRKTKGKTPPKAPLEAANTTTGPQMPPDYVKHPQPRVWGPLPVAFFPGKLWRERYQPLLPPCMSVGFLGRQAPAKKALVGTRGRIPACLETGSCFRKLLGNKKDYGRRPFLHWVGFVPHGLFQRQCPALCPRISW